MLTFPARAVAVLTIALVASLVPVAASAAPSPGTSIGNAGVLTSSGSGTITATSDDWWVIYPSVPGQAVDVSVEDTAAEGTSCADIEATMYGTDGTSQEIAIARVIIPADIVTLTGSLSGSDRYFIEVDSEGCTSAAPYTLTLVSGGGVTPPPPVPAYVAAGTSSKNAGPPLRGHAYYTNTLSGAGSEGWYRLYKKASSTSATIRVQDTTVYANASLACPGLTASLYKGTNTSDAIASVSLFGNSATTFTVPGTQPGDPHGLYYLEITSTGCDTSSTYSIEPETAAQWRKAA